jgi:YceI-like domain
MILGTTGTNLKNMNRFLSLAIVLLPALASAQVRYSTRTGEVTFHSETPMENIDAANHKGTSVIDLTSGQIQVSMLIKAFEFEKALMQEHFNENYMESGTYPKGEFKGKLVGFTAENVSKPGKYDVTLEGELTIHGVAQKRTLKGAIEVDATGALKAATDFTVKPADHGIKVPGGVNVAEEIQVKARLDYQKM